MDKNHKKLLQYLKMWVMLILTGGLLHSSVYWGCKREHWKEPGRPNFQKENGRVSAFQQKQSTALIVWGGLEMFCFVLTLRKKMGTIRISPKKGGIWALPTGSISSVGFALAGQGWVGPCSPPSAPRAPLLSPLLSPAPPRCWDAFLLLWRSGDRAAMPALLPARSPLSPLIPPQIKWQPCRCGRRGECCCLHNGHHRLHPVTLLQVINCPVKCCEIHCVKMLYKGDWYNRAVGT